MTLVEDVDKMLIEAQLFFSLLAKQSDYASNIELNSNFF